MPVILLHIRARFYLSIIESIFLPVIKDITEKEVKLMNKLQISARMKIWNVKLEGFKQQMAEIIQQTKEKDTGTLQYDWFLSNDQAECEIHETYESSDALAEHKHNLRKIDLLVKPGEFVAIIGKSGSGKSTMLNMLGGIDSPTSGEIWVGGSPVHTMDPLRLVRSFSGGKTC